MAESGYIVKTPALGRFKIRCLRVEQMQRDYFLGYPFQDVQNRGAVHKAFAWFLTLEQGFDFSFADSEAVRIDRNGLSVFEQSGCALKSHDCRHAEFSGHIGKMSGFGPLFGDKGGGPAEQSGPPGQRLFYNKDCSPGKTKGLAFFPDHENRPKPGSGTCSKTTRNDHFTIRDDALTLPALSERVLCLKGRH